MGRKRLIYDTRDLQNASKEILAKVDKALVAAAFRVCDSIRSIFKDSSSLYKYSTESYFKLAEGIKVGKLQNSQIKIHALGSRDNPESYKTRFFVGGTKYRIQSKRAGLNIKPFTKGYIKANDAVEHGIANAESILDNYIKNVL